MPQNDRPVKEIQVNNACRWLLQTGLTEKVPDSTHRQANANPRKGVSEYMGQLNTAVEADRKRHEKKPLPGVKKDARKHGRRR